MWRVLSRLEERIENLNDLGLADDHRTLADV